MQELFEIPKKTKVKDKALKSQDQVYIDQVFPDL